MPGSKARQWSNPLRPRLGDTVTLPSLHLALFAHLADIGVSIETPCALCLASHTAIFHYWDDIARVMVAFEVESSIWYGVATCALLARLVARILHFGTAKQLQVDDYLMTITLAFYTTEVVTLNKAAIAKTNLLPPGYLQNHTMTPAETADRVYGSKMTLIVEQCQCVTIWLVKACLLMMYHRITVGAFQRQNLLVKILAVYVGITFIVMETFYFGVWCRPFANYFAVPTPVSQCTTALHHLIMNAAFNLSSDLAMLAIALPMFIRSHLPLQRKVTLCFIFSLGAFVILSAVLNKYYSFTDPFGVLWVYWYVRECSTAILVANLPFLWGLLRKCLGLRKEDSSPESPTIHAGQGFIPNLRRRFGVITGMRGSLSTTNGTAFSSGKRKPSRGRSRSPIARHDETQDVFAMQSFDGLDPPKSPEAGLGLVCRSSSRASARSFNDHLPPLAKPTSRLEAELMIDDGIPSPRIPLHLCTSEDASAVGRTKIPVERLGK